ncbi:MAG: hypothetical protein IRY98_13090, partial [Alicyclobacillaceae bacterium]|nr:hypothetical protein [Alicyclobacillaceae bacterium]
MGRSLSWRLILMGVSLSVLAGLWTGLLVARSEFRTALEEMKGIAEKEVVLAAREAPGRWGDPGRLAGLAEQTARAINAECRVYDDRKRILASSFPDSSGSPAGSREEAGDAGEEVDRALSGEVFATVYQHPGGRL